MLAGSFDKFVKLEDFVAVNYDDFKKTIFFEIPPVRFANLDLIFKVDKRSEYFLFDNSGKWVEENIGMPGLHFENVFDEKKWMYDNCPLG